MNDAPLSRPWHRILDHAPQPGPQHWDWRCLACGEPVSWHGGLLARWLYRRRVRRGRLGTWR